MGDRFLVVCRDNFVRSRVVCDHLLNKGYNSESCGVGFLSVILGRRYKSHMGSCFDSFIACDIKVKNKLIRFGVDSKRIISLDIPNIYWRFIPFKILFIKPIRHLKRDLENKLEAFSNNV